MLPQVFLLLEPLVTFFALEGLFKLLQEASFSLLRSIYDATISRFDHKYTTIHPFTKGNTNL